MRFSSSDVETVAFLFGSEGTSKFRLLNLDCKFVFDSEKFNIIERTEN